MTTWKQDLPKWVEIEAEKKPRRKPGPKPKPSETKLHVKVNLSGTVEFDLEGLDAIGLKGSLERLELDEILEFVDPWASGAELRYDVEVTDLVGPDRWEANETTGTIEHAQPDPFWEFK